LREMEELKDSRTQGLEKREEKTMDVGQQK
jgi:hypothetical protein